MKQRRARRMSRSDFMFTIGYRGNTAIVDRAARKRYARLTVEGLLEQDLHKAALCAAEYDDDKAAQLAVLNSYNKQSVVPVADLTQLRARFGVFGVPDSVNNVDRV